MKGLTLALLALFIFLGAVPMKKINEATLHDAYLDSYLKSAPSVATTQGVHDYDSDLADFSRAAIQSKVDALKIFLKKYEGIDGRALSLVARNDLEIVKNHIRARLLELEEVRMWERNPDFYSSLVSESLFVLVARNFAPLEERLKHVIEREKKAIGFLEIAKKNLKNPPAIYTRIALEQLPGIISFVEKDIPLAFAAVSAGPAKDQFYSSNEKLVAALKDYQQFVQKTLLPKSKGDYRLGESLYRRKLLYEEMIETPLSELLVLAEQDLKKNQDWFAKVAGLAYPGLSATEALHRLESEYPKPEKTLDVVREKVKELKKFVIDKNIATIPSDVLPLVAETPAFMRATTMASMDTPGPFEKKTTEAYYNVTLPEADWSPEVVKEHMAGLNIPLLSIVSIHEAYPGHYTQFLWLEKAPSRVRKLLGANSNAEGWAHYAEQMVLDEGFHAEDPKLRLGQLQDALLRNARFVVGIKLHTGKMSYDEGVAFFEREGFQSHANAERETKRGTSDPTYLYYTLGKLEIMKLREEYKKKMGSKFSLRAFHDAILSRGYPPIPVLRKELLETPDLG